MLNLMHPLKTNKNLLYFRIVMRKWSAFKKRWWESGRPVRHAVKTLNTRAGMKPIMKEK